MSNKNGEVKQPVAELEALIRFLEKEVWPKVPPELLGRTLTRAEEDEILGLGPEGA